MLHRRFGQNVIVVESPLLGDEPCKQAAIKDEATLLQLRPLPRPASAIRS